MNKKYLVKYIPKMYEAAVQLPFKVRVAAVILGKDIRTNSLSTNDCSKTHPILLKYNKTCPSRIYLHAEIRAIIRDSQLNSIKPEGIFIIRISKNDKYLMPSLPCPICLEAIKDYGIKSVYAFTKSVVYNSAINTRFIKVFRV